MARVSDAGVLGTLVLLGLCANGILCSSESMTTISTGFLKLLGVCKKELNLNDHIVADFYHYWKEEYNLLNRDTGCAIVCMSKKLDIMDADGKIHPGNTREFAKKHGADDEVSLKMASLLDECEETHKGVEDECLRALDIAMCFRTGIHQLNWVPDIDVVIAELLAEFAM